MNTKSNFSAALCKVRESAGMTQQELATASGIPVETIQQWESQEKGAGTSNRIRPTIEETITLASAMNISPFDICNAAIDESKFFKQVA